MSDSTWITISFEGVPEDKTFIEQLVAHVKEHVYGMSEKGVRDTINGDSGGGECSVGSASELDDSLAEFIAETGVDFGYDVYDEPRYEYLGDLFEHKAGQGTFHAVCDGEGRPLIESYDLLRHVEEATSLARLQYEIRLRTDATFFFDQPLEVQLREHWQNPDSTGGW